MGGMDDVAFVAGYFVFTLVPALAVGGLVLRWRRGARGAGRWAGPGHGAGRVLAGTGAVRSGRAGTGPHGPHDGLSGRHG
jgi:hypothetical protein